MNIQELELGRCWNARLVANVALTAPGSREEVRELTLEVEGGVADFRAGQSVEVLIAGPLDFGQRQHVRLYTVAATAAERGPGRFSLCVRRCSYLDPYSGERYPGIASNHLCDLSPGSTLRLAGPVGLPFLIPQDPRAPLLLVGLGTGIAAFRALLHEVLVERAWQGRVLLFQGARSGLEAVYRDTLAALAGGARSFTRIEVASPRPAWDDPVDLAGALSRHRDEVWQLLQDPASHVYLAGLAVLAQQLDGALAAAAGSSEAWAARKAEMAAAGRWMSVLY